MRSGRSVTFRQEFLRERGEVSQLVFGLWGSSCFRDLWLWVVHVISEICEVENGHHDVSGVVEFWSCSKMIQNACLVRSYAWSYITRLNSSSWVQCLLRPGGLAVLLRKAYLCAICRKRSMSTFCGTMAEKDSLCATIFYLHLERCIFEHRMYAILHLFSNICKRLRTQVSKPEPMVQTHVILVQNLWGQFWPMEPADLRHGTSKAAAQKLGTAAAGSRICCGIEGSHFQIDHGGLGRK